MNLRKEVNEIIENTIDLHKQYKSNYNPLPPYIMDDLDERINIFKNSNKDLMLLCTTCQGIWNTVPMTD